VHGSSWTGHPSSLSHRRSPSSVKPGQDEVGDSKLSRHLRWADFIHCPPHWVHPRGQPASIRLWPHHRRHDLRLSTPPLHGLRAGALRCSFSLPLVVPLRSHASPTWSLSGEPCPPPPLKTGPPRRWDALVHLPASPRHQRGWSNRAIAGAPLSNMGASCSPTVKKGPAKGGPKGNNTLSFFPLYSFESNSNNSNILKFVGILIELRIWSNNF
jgi:hypothetical protein